MSNGNGWDDPKPQSTGGKRLFLGHGDKGVPVRLRFVGQPKRLPDTTTDDGKTLRKYACRVIQKLAVDGKVERVAKWFEFSPMVYFAIADLWKDADWGNPENYDVEVTRTEEKGKYYVVVPKPNCKPLTDEDRELVEALGSHEDAISGSTANGDGDFDPFASE